MLEGVQFKQLETHADERGFFREIIRGSDDFFEEGFGQLSHSLMHQGVIKAWHWHKKQVDWVYVPSGVLRLVLFDARVGSSTYKELAEFLLGDHQAVQLVRIPTGVWHGCQALQGPCHLIYVTSQEYNPSDEWRVPHDAPAGGVPYYDWLKGPAIK